MEQLRRKHPRWVGVLTALGTTYRSAGHYDQAPTVDSRTALADQLASGQDKLEKTAEKLVGVEDVIDVARADVQRIAIEFAEGRDPKSVTQELLQVRSRVDQAAKILPEVVADLDILHDR